nr:5-formyltetrahydrofolate cyclo-ligase [Aquicella siphonis]
MRRHFRQVRSKVDAPYREHAALAAANVLEGHPVFIQSRHIACYLPAKDEFETLHIIKMIWKARKHCYLPVLSGQDENALQFAAYDEGDALRLNRYQIQEPVNTGRSRPPQELDLVITPLLAFDSQGGRLGMGGGFYDRTFAFLHSKMNRTPKLIGLAFSSQEAEELPSDTWDIRLDGVLTEKALISFS